MLNRIIMEEFRDLVKTFEEVFQKEVVEALDGAMKGVYTLSLTALKNIGMTGNQLELKGTLIIGLIDRARKFFSDPIVQKIIRWIKKAFGAINSFLGSLGSLLPPLEIAKEFKEQVNNALA